MDKSAAEQLGIKTRLDWPDIMKAFAFILIFWVHLVERLFGAVDIGNPHANWSGAHQQLQQLAPLTGNGIWDIPLNVFRYVGWFGDHGVQLFLIVSGFGLAYGWYHKSLARPLALKEFYIDRAWRVYPMWVSIHILIGLVAVLSPLVISLPSLTLSMIGIRFTSGLFYYISPAWWYIGLLIQLYIVFPFMLSAINRWGPLRFLVVTLGVSFSIRCLGLLFLEDSAYLDAWSRGAIFITRLPEFATGIALAFWMYHRPKQTDSLLLSPRAVTFGLASIAIGLCLSVSIVGMTFALWLIGIGLFAALYPAAQLFGGAQSIFARILKLVGIHSYSLYLVHQIVISVLIKYHGGMAFSEWQGEVPILALSVVAAIVVTWCAAMALEFCTYKAPRMLADWIYRVGRWRLATFAGAALILIAVLALTAEVLVEWKDPQEVHGWGERPSLAQDEELGWRLIPNKVTRLRWLGYDYTIRANALGFPGPDIPEARSPGVMRVMVVGDAFSSAEGVDTDKSWVRQLETKLRVAHREAEVQNFAITGYGPNQYSAVLQKFVPIYKPDVIIVEMFVNDYHDVTTSNQSFQDSIGFGSSRLSSWMGEAALPHLREWLRHTGGAFVNENLLGKPAGLGYFLGNFHALEVSGTVNETSANKVRDRLDQINRVAQQNNAKLMIVLVPASVQVCKAGDLEYFPRHVDLLNAKQFDLDKPQRQTAQIAKSLQIPFWDLRPALMAGKDCPYQPRNMHWTELGHGLVSDFVASRLLE